MKELSIEDKAKAYDELIKRLNKAREDVGGYTFKSVYDEVMSELAESEDEKFLRYLIDCCKDTIESDDKGLELSMVTTKRLFAWLEKQGEKGINGKNREIPFSEQKPAWGEEDEKYLIYNIEQDYKDKLNNNPPESLRPYYNKVISWLKSRIPQKQELSKEDDRLIKVVKEMAYTIAQTSDKQFLERHGTNEQELKNWSLSCRPQNRWKPSDEQMDVLNEVIRNPYLSTAEYNGLVALREQLKAL